MGRFDRLPGIDSEENTTRRNVLVGGAYGFVGLGVVGAITGAGDDDDNGNGDGGSSGNGDDNGNGNGEDQPSEGTDDSGSGNGNGNDTENGEAATSDDDDSSTDENGEPLEPTVEFQSIAAVDDLYDADAYSFDGSGGEVTDELSLDEGLAILVYEYNGERNFIVELVNGDYPDLLANEVGTSSGVGGAQVDSGSYRMDVEAAEGGTWSLSLAQPDTGVEIRPDAPVSASGEGNDVVGPLWLEGGEVSRGSHTGERNFIVEYVDEQFTGFGTWEIAHNEIGNVDEDETILSIDGPVWAIIEADGEWTLELK